MTQALPSPETRSHDNPAGIFENMPARDLIIGYLKYMLKMAKGMNIDGILNQLKSIYPSEDIDNIYSEVKDGSEP